MGDVACGVPNYRSSSYPLGGSSLTTQINMWGIFFLLYVQGKCVCKHMEAGRQPQVCPQGCCPLLWAQCLPLSRSSPIRHAWGWLVSLSDPSLSTSTALGLQAHTTTPCIFMWVRGIRFRSSGLTSALLTEPFHCLWVPGVLTKLPILSGWNSLPWEWSSSSRNVTLTPGKGRISVFITVWSNVHPASPWPTAHGKVPYRHVCSFSAPAFCLPSLPWHPQPWSPVFAFLGH